MTPRQSSTTPLARVVAPVAVTGIMLASSGFAQAAGELQVSADGVQWATSYSGPLIAGGQPLSPGSGRSGSVYVRNSTAGDATLGVATGDVTAPDGVLLDVALVEGSTVVASTTRSLAELDASPDLGLGDVMEGRGVRRLDVTVRLDESAGNDTQQSSIAFTLVVTLQGDVIEVPGTPHPGLPTQPGPLPRTGSDNDPLLIAALAVIAAGLSLRLLSRHRR